MLYKTAPQKGCSNLPQQCMTLFPFALSTVDSIIILNTCILPTQQEKRCLCVLILFFVTTFEIQHYFFFIICLSSLVKSHSNVGCKFLCPLDQEPVHSAAHFLHILRYFAHFYNMVIFFCMSSLYIKASVLYFENYFPDLLLDFCLWQVVHFYSPKSITLPL